jgi:hypothetical protein
MVGDTRGFVGIGTNVQSVMKSMRKMIQELDDAKAIQKIHRGAGNIVRKEMRSNIKDADQVIKVRRSGKRPMSKKSKRGPSIDIPIGTLKRSVHVWRIPRTNDFWVGPRAGFMQGKAIAVNKDGWFANIVEGDDQMFRLNGTPNAGVFERSERLSQPAAERYLIEGWSELIDKAAKKARNT